MKLTLLVGSHFCPPAKAVLKHLMNGAKVSFVKDPNNPYDENAIKVMIEPRQMFNGEEYVVYDESYIVDFAAYGEDIDEVLQRETLMLGHIAASGGKPHSPNGTHPCAG